MSVELFSGERISQEYPALFNDEMVRAILSGRKTVTRRFGSYWGKVAAGDKLWVRECWGGCDGFYGEETEPPRVIGYRADRSARRFHYHEPDQWEAPPDYDIAQWNWETVRWRPSIHMPRWASRITLEVVNSTEVRLSTITVADVRAEGIEPDPIAPFWDFKDLWDKLNASRQNGAYAWDKNPLVQRIEFKVLP